MKITGIILLILVLGVIVLTWGSIASAVLTMALLLAGGYVLMHHLITDRGDDNYWLED